MADTKTPVKTSLIAVAINIVLNLILMKPLGFRGLATAASVSAMVNLFLLLVVLDRRIGPLNRKDIWETFFKILSSSVFMGIILWLYLRFFGLNLQTSGLFPKIGELLVILLLGLASYTIISYLLKLKELDRILVLLKIRQRNERM